MRVESSCDLGSPSENTEEHQHSQKTHKIFREDDHPWITASPKGMVVVMLLRRLAYNMVALFRSVTQRSDERRQTPWKTVLRWFYNAIVATTAEQLEDLRARPLTEGI